MTPPSDSTDKDRTPYKSHPDQHGHWDVQDIAALLHERDALQTRYDALKAAGEDMEAAIRSLDHTVAQPLYASECPVCIALDTYCDIAFRAATGKGREDE